MSAGSQGYYQCLRHGTHRCSEHHRRPHRPSDAPWSTAGRYTAGHSWCPGTHPPEHTGTAPHTSRAHQDYRGRANKYRPAGRRNPLHWHSCTAADTSRRPYSTQASGHSCHAVRHHGLPHTVPAIPDDSLPWISCCEPPPACISYHPVPSPS